MEKSISDKITDLVSQGETGNALNLLRDHISTVSPRDENLHHSVVMLLGRYNKFEREQRLGLEPDAKDLNRIEYNLLQITEDLRKGKSTVNSRKPAVKRQTQTAERKRIKSSTGSPILWIFATFGFLILLLFVVGIMIGEEPDITTVPADAFETEEFSAELDDRIQPVKPRENPAENVNPRPTLTEINDKIIRDLLAGSSWYDTTNGNGFIKFDALGKFATYLEGMGSIQVETIGTDGLIYAVYYDPNNTQAYLAISPQMEGNNLRVFVQNPATGVFLTVPMIWTKQ